MVVRIVKPDNFLKMEFVGYECEDDHLGKRTKQDEEELVNKIVELSEQGLSLRKIAEELQISHMKVKRELDKLDLNTSEDIH